MTKISTTLKRQLNDFINNGETLVNIINYLFTCDYEAAEIIRILVHNFGCKEQLLKDVLAVDFGIEFSPIHQIA